jgi:hypothetical protein
MIELEPLPSVRPAVLGRTYIVASGHYLTSALSGGADPRRVACAVGW